MANVKKICVVFDAGHGGKDRANRGPTGYVEADGCLKMAKFAKRYVEMASKDFVVHLTRDIDKTMSIGERVAFTKSVGCEMMFSFHTNAGGGGKARGTEGFYSIDLPNTKAFISGITAEIASTFGTADRGAKIKESEKYPGEDYLGIIDGCQDAGMLAFLLEPLFHDNPTEEKLLKDDNNLKKIAYIVAKHIVTYYGYKFNVDPRALDAPKKVETKNPNIIHTVAKGETLYGICQKYGIKIGQIILDNKIKNPDSIFVGQKLLITNPKKNPT